MKKAFLLSIIIISVWHTCSSQTWTSDFESKNYINYLFIDTLTNPKNVWQIGKPSKTIFNSAYSPTHAIVTDTLNSYPINNSSNFMIKLTSLVSNPIPIDLSISFYFKLNTDSLSDFGRLEISNDTGKTWVDLMKNDSFLLKPIGRTYSSQFTGNTNGWKDIQLGVSKCVLSSKNIFFKFSFISDSVNSQKEGWIIDDINIQIAPVLPGIEELFDQNSISAYPNPVSDKLYISSPNHSVDYLYYIFDFSGKLILESLTDERSINVSQLPEGLYVLKYKQEDKMSIQKFIIKR